MHITCLQALLKFIHFKVVKCGVIASQCFTKVITDQKENVSENIFNNTLKYDYWTCYAILNSF
jgi:hypothetical protein